MICDKLEKILHHQFHLNFNVPYGPDDIANPGWAATKRILFFYNNLTWKQSREIYLT